MSDHIVSSAALGITEAQEKTFSSSLGVRLTVGQVVHEIARFMKDEPNRFYKITIGTDSELLSDKTADFVSAIVVHRVGNGGRYFWRQSTLGKFHNLRQRIIREVVISLELATELLEELRLMESNMHPKIAWDFEVHADVGVNGPTKEMLSEVVGMIRAYNFSAKTKPESYAASNVADRHV